MPGKRRRAAGGRIGAVHNRDEASKAACVLFSLRGALSYDCTVEGA